MKISRLLWGAGLVLMVNLSVTGLQAGVINVFLVGGQSNADGRDFKPETVVPKELAMQNDVSFYYSRKPNFADETPTSLSGKLIPLQPTVEAPNTIHFGPELSFGRAMADYYAKQNQSVAILKFSVGGSDLFGAWKADGVAIAPGPQSKDGVLYRNFQTLVGKGLAELKAAHPGDEIVVRGMIWLQGEADASDQKKAEAYEENLKRLIADVRLTYGSQLPFIIGEISQKVLPYLSVVRTAQSNVAKSDPLNAIVDTEGLTMKDALHFDGAGQIVLGGKYAEAMQGLLK